MLLLARLPLARHSQAKRVSVHWAARPDFIDDLRVSAGQEIATLSGTPQVPHSILLSTLAIRSYMTAKLVHNSFHTRQLSSLPDFKLSYGVRIQYSATTIILHYS